MGIFSEKKEKNKIKEINQNIQNTQERNKNNDITPEHNLTNQNSEQHSDFQSNEKAHENNNLNNISLNMEENDQIEDNDSKLLGSKRIREDKYYPNNSNNFSFKKNNNSQNNFTETGNKDVMKQIEEEEAKLNELLKKLESYKKIVANEIDRRIINGQENNINNNMSRQDLQKTIRNIMETSIRQNEDVKQIECIYKSLNPNSQTTLKSRLEKIEEKLNEDTYLKTKIIKNKKTDINPLSKLKENKIQLIEIKEEENENEEENNKQNEKKNINVGQQKNKQNLNKNQNNIKIDAIKIDDIKRKSLNLSSHIKLKNFNDYSFKCLTTNLNFSIYKGTSELKFKLKLENDGSFPWPKNQTILSTDKSKSNIKIKEIILDPLNPTIKRDFDVLFRNMNQLSEGKYYSNLEFRVSGKKFGDNILINVDVLEDIKKKYEPVIEAIRDEYLMNKNTAIETAIEEGIDKIKTKEAAFNFKVENNLKNKNK